MATILDSADLERKSLSNELKRSLGRLCLEINNKDLFKALTFANSEQSWKKIQKCCKEERKVQSSYTRKYILENNHDAFLTLGLVQNGYQLDVRQSE